MTVTLATLPSGASVIVLRSDDGTAVAYRNACPHMGIELDWDAKRLLTRNGKFLQCTGHGALFDPATGLCVRGPCKGETLTRVAVRIDNDRCVFDQDA